MIWVFSNWLAQFWSTTAHLPLFLRYLSPSLENNFLSEFLPIFINNKPNCTAKSSIYKSRPYLYLDSGEGSNHSCLEWVKGIVSEHKITNTVPFLEVWEMKNNNKVLPFSKGLSDTETSLFLLWVIFSTEDLIINCSKKYDNKLKFLSFKKLNVSQNLIWG